MPRSSRRSLPAPRSVLTVGLGALVALGLVSPAQSSSHREAPMISEDPTADNTDVYAFVAPDAPGTVTLISNFNGFQEPGGGPNYFKFGDDVLYEIKIDNDGDAVEDVTYGFRFSTTTVDPDSFLYATGPITSIDDSTWNRPQRYTVFRNGTEVASNLLTPPANVGPRSTPDYEALAAQAVHDLPGGGQVFAGQRDEGFYVDIASIFDLGGLRPLNSAHAVPLPDASGIDTFAGYNVQSIALQVPTSDLVAGSEPVIGVWSTASRQATRTLTAGDASFSGDWVQVSRLGSPLVNEVVIPLGLKDAFNSLEPSQDAATLAGVQAPPLATEGDIPLVTDPIIAGLVEALYGVSVPPAPRDDLVSIFLTGVADVNQPANVVPAEMLRLNTSVTPTAFADQDRLGLLAGQADGFPNGRRVGDDVVDIALRAVAGGTPFTPDFNVAPNNALSDGANANDRPYLGSFPYLATPHQGYDLNNPARVTTAGPPVTQPTSQPSGQETAAPTTVPAGPQLPVTGWGPTLTSFLAAAAMIASVLGARRLVRSRAGQ
ncbi:MAG TPA: DUF4331 domain-containing protein [Acidimicrobiales bacterium]|nr:DUF4331 domain-containing protein [Acidimicrobiales bacterium]